MARRRKNLAGYLFVAPAALYLAVFSFLPMGVAAYLSLHRWHLLKPDHPYVGLENYRALAHDPFFIHSLGNSLTFVVLSVPLGMALALGVALMVNKPLRGVRIFRTLFFIPAVSSLVALSMVWIWVYMPDKGLINSLLKVFGFSGRTNFLNNTTWALPALVFMSMWIGLGPRMVIFLAGLQAIPESLYESARIDGCGPWQQFKRITLPLLLPTTFFVLVTSTIAAFKYFTEVYVMTQGGPRRATDVVAYHIYNDAWRKYEIGLASAESYVLFAVILAAAALQFALMRRQLASVEDAWR